MSNRGYHVKPRASSQAEVIMSNRGYHVKLGSPGQTDIEFRGVKQPLNVLLFILFHVC